MEPLLVQPSCRSSPSEKVVWASHRIPPRNAQGESLGPRTEPKVGDLKFKQLAERGGVCPKPMNSLLPFGQFCAINQFDSPSKSSILRTRKECRLKCTFVQGCWRIHYILH